MATREQCEKALRKRLITPDDISTFAAGWGGDIRADETTEQFIERTIEDAHGGEHLDQLGVHLGFPSDEESLRLDSRTRFLLALLVAVAGLALAGIALWRNW